MAEPDRPLMTVKYGAEEEEAICTPGK